MGKIIFGNYFINHPVDGFSVGAKTLRNYLNHLKENGLVNTPGDRADIILGALQAHQSANYPNISGIVLTGGIIPEEPICKLIEGLSDILPIISVQGGTFAIANRIGGIKSKIYAENTEKIQTSINDFETYVPTEELMERFFTSRTAGLTPRLFQYNFLMRPKTHK